MRIGDSVTHKGRRYIVVGFTPMSVNPTQVELLEPQTDTRLWVDWPLTQGERAALKVVAHKDKKARS